jgi:hypothetical protein
VAGALVKLEIDDKAVADMVRQPAMVTLLTEAGQRGAEYARSMAPEYSGRYAASIQALTPFVNREGILEGGLGSDSFIWHFVEFGGARSAPQRVLSNAAMAITGGYAEVQAR